MSEPTHEEVTALLTEARRLITEVGWVQGTFRLWDERAGRPVGYCLAGAVSEAGKPYSADKGWNPTRNNAFELIRRAIDPTSETSVVGFNDAPDRVKAEVLLVLDRAIRREAAP